MALYHCDCPEMRADYYCPEHNPLGGDYSRIRAELEANPPEYHPARRERIEHEGRYGWGRYRRPRMDRRRRAR